MWLYCEVRNIPTLALELRPLLRAEDAVGAAVQRNADGGGRQTRRLAVDLNGDRLQRPQPHRRALRDPLAVSPHLIQLTSAIH